MCSMNGFHIYKMKQNKTEQKFDYYLKKKTGTQKQNSFIYSDDDDDG